MPALFVALLLLAAAPALAEEAAAPTGVLTKAPALTAFVEALFPPEAKAAGVGGEVSLEVDISETGAVLDAKVVRPAGNGFDEAALAAVKAFVFSPAEIDGKPASVRIEYVYRFEFKPEPKAPPTPEAPVAPVAANVVNFRGFVVTRGSKAPVLAARLEVGSGESAKVVQSDKAGFFEVTDVPVGRVKIVVEDERHERFETEEEVVAGLATEVRYFLRRKLDTDYRVEVRDQREKKEVATVALSVAEITKIPGVSGDTVKVVQNLPGVARPPGGAGLLIIRGGNADDTRVYVDAQEVPLIFHFGGLTSVYSSELIEEVQFEPGNFGARYGRATAGRIELISRDPKTDRYHFVLDADLYDGTAFVEGPINDDLSFALATRRSWVDGVLILALENAPPGIDAPGFTIAPRYWDYQLKSTWKASTRDTFRLQLFGSQDNFSIVGIDSPDPDAISQLSFTTYFARSQLSWEHRFDEKTKVKTLFAFGHDTITFDAPPFLFDLGSWPFTVRSDLSHEVNDHLTLQGGLDLLYTTSTVEASLPTPSPPGQINSPYQKDNLTAVDVEANQLQPALYVEAVWRPFEDLKLIPGVRFDYDQFLGNYWVDPRFAARWTFREGTTLKGGVGLYQQPPVIQNGTAEFGNPELNEEAAIQYAIGVEHRIWGPLSIDTQLYWKELFDLTLPTDEVVVKDGKATPLRYVNEGTGRSYGLEALLRYDPDGRFFGWIAYSLSKTERDQVAGQNFGGNGPSATAFDTPHNVVALGSVELPEVLDGLSFGFRLRYTTGNPYKKSVGAFYDADSDEYSNLATDTRDERQPDFIQLDLRVDKKWTAETWTYTLYIDVQNATNRENTAGVQYNYDYTKSQFTTDLPIFPSLGMRFEY